MRIAIVNDSRMAVEALRRVVTSVPGYEIAWIAPDGSEAVRQCRVDVPDVILMDLMMPVMDGVEASRLIMRDSPCAILVVTATVEGHASRVFDAMGAGALDAVNTPVLGPSGGSAGGAQLLSRIAMLGKLVGRPGPRQRAPVADAPTRAAGALSLPLVAIGASTGGPRALVRVLTQLPVGLPAVVTIVQHIDAQFAPGLAAWLGTETGHVVRAISGGDRPAPGVLLAVSNDHLTLTSALAFDYVADPLDYPYRPSIDVFFKSIVRRWTPGNAVGVLLTGMGADGAEGLLAMRLGGCHTIAQDEATCIVYGMPKAAAHLGAPVEVLPIDLIGPAIIRALHAFPSAAVQRSYP